MRKTTPIRAVIAALAMGLLLPVAACERTADDDTQPEPDPLTEPGTTPEAPDDDPAPETPDTELAVPDEVQSYDEPYPVFGEVVRLDEALDDLVPPDAEIQKLADGFVWVEGPVWLADREALLFNDIPRNSTFEWTEREGLTLFMKPSGYTGDREDLGEPGANGMFLDHEGRLLMCEHGDRRVARLDSLDEPRGFKTTLAAEFEGRRLNSPNDLVVHSSGDIYFTDPPYGLAERMDDPEKELDFQGVYLIRMEGDEPVDLILLTDELERPNGIHLSPDERTLYVANSHPPNPVIMAYELAEDGAIANGRVLFDASHLLEEGLPGLPDGMAIDRDGNIFTTGPGGVLVLTPEGEHLGTIGTGFPIANCVFGDDGSTLYMTANNDLARIRLNTTGAEF